MNGSPKSLYAAFDVYPSAKGAARHIQHMASTLFRFTHGGMLYVMGNEDLPAYQEEENNIIIKRYYQAIPNYLERAHAYSWYLKKEIERNSQLEICHFRDVWSGLAILQKERSYKTIYEVNGLYSIELPYRYPDLSRATLAKVRKLELKCMQESDRIITPSHTTKLNLAHMGIDPTKITVIPNGADQPIYPKASPFIQNPYIIYFGALQPWQGVDVLLKAMQGLQDYPELRLVICSSSKARFIKAYKKLADKLGILDKVIWLYQLPQEVLNMWIRSALISVAPLKETERNLKQGCSPLKIFESMACGTAVLASDLPVVREVITNHKNGKLVRPDRPAVLSRGIRYLLEEEAERKRLAQNGQKHVLENYSWPTLTGKLMDLYQEVCTLGQT